MFDLQRVNLSAFTQNSNLFLENLNCYPLNVFINFFLSKNSFLVKFRQNKNSLLILLCLMQMHHVPTSSFQIKLPEKHPSTNLQQRSTHPSSSPS